MTEVKDLIIIGSGPAGYTAGLYAGRAMLNPTLFAGFASGGQLMLTSDIENFPGYPEGIGGPEMMLELRSQASRFGCEIIDKNVDSVDFSQRPFKLNVGKEVHLANSIIITTGAEAIWLDAINEDVHKGRGISTCATCDGAFFRDKEVIVIGGGDSAMEEATFLTKFCSKVTIVHRREGLRASQIMADRAKANSKIDWKLNYSIKEWLGSEGNFEGALLVNTKTGSEEKLECDGAFIAIGHKPMTSFLNDQLETDESGYLLWKENTMTSVPGVFAGGDVVDTRYRQAITAAGMGCMAAIDVEKWLENNSH
ncbi:MAG: thioredoxin-disulfide reductase [Marine Group III euryarchaeote CG-Epi2]|uniref:Thioredoxin-disulfide reductase n=1 Tax=Marine Group III euryarchaeote CG-Epi2 TaxID=1888996 RepID=A0A1J5TNJ2_9ARCH|nr:MAG: thioredoxin-disulfide reductase [Marine Group III euryarchaeote CG-Epi2]